MRTLTLRMLIVGTLVAATLIASLVAVGQARAITLPGDVLWQRTCTTTYGGDGFVEMARGPGGVVYAVGTRAYKDSTGTKDCLCVLAVKYSPSGKLLWKRSLAGGVIPNGSEGQDLAVDGHGNVTVAGMKNTTTHSLDIVVARYSPTGKLLWTRTYNGTADTDDWPSDLALDRSGNALVSGYTTTASDGWDALLLKLSSRSGRRLWTYTYNNSAADSDDSASAVVLDHGGAAYLSGWSANAGNVTSAVLVVKVSAAGKQLWEQRLQLNDRGVGRRIALDGNGDVAVAGNSTAAGDFNLFAAKLKPATGAQAWTPRIIASAFNQDLSDMVIGRCHNDIFLVGASGGATVPRGVIADVKYNGVLLWATFFSPSNLVSGSLSWEAVALDSHDDLFVTGRDASPTNESFEVSKAEWDGAWPLWQTFVAGSVPGYTRPKDLIWVGGASGGVYACGVITKAGVDYAFIAKYQP
jgi:hypothetical protein